MKSRFFLLDLDYRVAEGKTYLELIGRINGKKVVLLYGDFLPYFYVEFEPQAKINVEELLTLTFDDYFIVNVKKEKKRLLNSEKEFYKVYVNSPKGVKPLKNLIKQKVKGFVHGYESSVPYVKRFLYDNDFSTFSYYEVEIDYDTKLDFFREYTVPSYLIKSIKLSDVSEPYEPKILALDIETYSKNKEINPQKNPILFISLYGKDFTKVLTHKKINSTLDFIEVLDSEEEMLKRLNYYLNELDPDILVGFFSDGFDLPYLSKRAKVLGVDFNFGVDSKGLKISGSTFKHAKIKGIVHIDLYRFVRGVLRSSLNLETFSLNEVSKELLSKEKIDVNLDDLSDSWENNKDLDTFAKYNLRDSELCYLILKKAFPIMDELGKLVSLPLFFVCRSNYSSLVEAYFLKREKEYNMISPNKPDEHELKERNSKTYEGAFVYQPEPGFYEDIVVFDFKSLYPTIIVSHNISPETCNADCKKKIYSPEKDVWFCQDEKGFVPYVLEDLISRRSRIKELMKQADESDKAILYARQYALKTVANSIYGYLGYPYSSWYCYECARSITSFGRMYIKQIIETFSKKGYLVLYSDTDSIFVSLNGKSRDKVLALVEQINKRLPGIMKLDLQGFYKSALFVSAKDSDIGAKKKYALLDEKGNIIVKGFETIRRDWSQIAKEVQEKVIELILNKSSKEEIVNYVREVINDVKSAKLPLDKVILKTQLRKDVNLYESRGPHVVAAERLIKQGLDVYPGMIISYVVSKYGSKLSEKIRLPTECTNNDYDAEYYISRQIIPAIKTLVNVVGISEEDLLNDSKQSSLSNFFAKK